MARPDDESGRFETSGLRRSDIVLSIASFGARASRVHWGKALAQLVDQQGAQAQEDEKADNV